MTDKQRAVFAGMLSCYTKRLNDVLHLANRKKVLLILDLPVRPVRGQTINLRMNKECTLTHSVRGFGNTYLVPKSDGRLTIGATVEEMGFDQKPTAGAIKELLEDAWEIIPSIYDLEIESIDVGTDSVEMNKN